MSSVGNDQSFRVLKEKVEILNGDRGDGRKAAVREGDAQDLREFIAKLRKGTADVQKNLAEAVETMAQLAADLETTQGDLGEAQDAISTAQDSLTALATAIADVETSISDAQAAIETLDSSGATIAATVDDIQDAAAAVSIPGMASTPVAAAPTQAEHNSLIDDVAAIRTALISLKAAVAS